MPDDGEAVSRWIDLDGETHYVDYGGPADGPLLVCVHGLGGSHLNWSALAPSLTSSCRVLAIDLAGHGKTQALGRSTTVEANRRLLDRFLRQVVGSPVILVGNSMGGMISVLETASNPRAVAGVVLIDPALAQRHLSRPDFRFSMTFLGYAIPGVGETVMAAVRRRAGPREMVDRILRLCCVDPTRVPRHVIERSVDLARERRSYPHVEAEFLKATRSVVRILVAPWRYEAKMRAITVPVLLLHGDKDRLVSIRSAQRAAAENPGWQFAVAQDIGHVPQLEAHEWTAEKILTWLAGPGAPAAAGAVGAARRR